MQRLLFCFITLVLVVFATAFVACDTRTSGVKLTLSAEAIGSLKNDKVVASFTNRLGWEIELKKARMLVGPLYLLEGEPQASFWDYFRPWGVAHAHVNANGQRVLAELREHFVLDLLKSTPTSLGSLRGIGGLAQTAEVHLLPPGGTRLSKDSAPISKETTTTVFAEGQAKKGQELRKFRVKLTLPKSDKKQLVTNIGTNVTLQEDEVAQNRLQIRVYVDRWFTNVDFAAVTNKDKEGYLVLTAENHAIVQGVRSRSSYRFLWRLR